MKKHCFLVFILLFFVTGASSQIFKTSLQITVLDRLGNVVEDAEVQLFKTFQDYQEETNPITEIQKTDKKGRVVFKGLEPKPYYVNVVKGKLNNHGEAEMVDTLIENRKNKVTIIIH